MIPTYGQPMTPETLALDNKTFNIIVESPENNIIIQQNNTLIENLLKQIIEQKEKEQQTDKDYRNGDVMLSSATILSFLGFGIFLFIRRNNSTNTKQLPKLTTVVLLCVLAIILLHFYAISEIILDNFSPSIYVSIIWITASIMIVITTTMIAINFVLSEIRKTQKIVGSIYPELDAILSEKRIELKQKKIDDMLEEFSIKMKDLKDSD